MSLGQEPGAWYITLVILHPASATRHPPTLGTPLHPTATMQVFTGTSPGVKSVVGLTNRASFE